MKKLSLVYLFILSLAGFGQDPKYFYCYKATTLETDDYKIYIEDAVNVDAYSKFKIRIFNKTNDYLILKPSDIAFIIGTQTLTSKDKQILIPPNEESAKVIDVKGKGLQKEKYTVEIKTVYKVSMANPPLKTEDIEFPLKKTEFTTGAFRCSIRKADLQTNRSILKFECVYEGDAIGIIAPGKCIAIMPKGQENQNNNKHKDALLSKKDIVDFAVEFREMKGGGDMQKEPWKILWNETFRESKMETIAGGSIQMEMDAVKTSEKNK